MDVCSTKLFLHFITIIIMCINPISHVIQYDKDAFSCEDKGLLECVVLMSATNNTFSLFHIKLNIITACCSAETQKDLNQYFSVLLFQPHPPLDNETQTISINTSKAAFP